MPGPGQMQRLGALPAADVKDPGGRPAQLRQPGELRPQHLLADHIAQPPEHAEPVGFRSGEGMAGTGGGRVAGEGAAGIGADRIVPAGSGIGARCYWLADRILLISAIAADYRPVRNLAPGACVRPA